MVTLWLTRRDYPRKPDSLGVSALPLFMVQTAGEAAVLTFTKVISLHAQNSREIFTSQYRKQRTRVEPKVNHSITHHTTDTEEKLGGRIRWARLHLKAFLTTCSQ